VPPGILAKDILPKLKQDPGYLKKKNMNVIDRDGHVVDPASLDFSSYTARNFPYQIRQEPGPTNALGRVKFIFPNPHFVFLHDTPSRSLFDRTTRTFSSGCIRTENPLDLAELLLEDPRKWNQETIARVLDNGAPKTVFLPEPLPVLILYWTVSVVDAAAPTFYPDVYGRDPAVLEALDADFEFRVPAELKAKLGGE
jgi:murein L,D-transpeptidase YcbB/YkuD